MVCKLWFLLQNCEAKFESHISLCLHILAQHPKEERYLCSVCNDEFKSVHELTDHITTHRGIYLCSVENCYFVAKEVDKFREHCEEKHCDEKEFECIQCKALFNNGHEQYIQHVEANKTELFNCVYCSYHSTQKDSIIDHMNLEHKEIRKQVRKNFILICDVKSEKCRTSIEENRTVDTQDKNEAKSLESVLNVAEDLNKVKINPEVPERKEIVNTSQTQKPVVKQAKKTAIKKVGHVYYLLSFQACVLCNT